MIDDLDDYYIAIGGDYGITCEEIDEERLTRFLNTLDKDIILTGDLGLSLSSKLEKSYKFIKKTFMLQQLIAKKIFFSYIVPIIARFHKDEFF